MRLERGFRRLLIVVAAILLVSGVALDTISMSPRATVRVTLRDGRQVDLERHEATKEALTNLGALSRAVAPTSKDVEPCVPARRDGSAKNYPDGFTPLDCAGDIVKTEILRGPHYRWWDDAVWSKVGLVLVAFLWLAFYTVRWIVRGFTGS